MQSRSVIVTEQERLAAGLRYLEQQKKADPLESFRSLEGLKGAYERRVQPIINNAMQTFETGGAVGDLLRAYGSAAAPANAAVLEGMGMPYRGPMTAPRQEGVSGGENFRAMGDPRQQAVGQMIGDPANLAQPVGARLANALKFAKPDAMKMVQEMSRGAMSPMDVISTKKIPRLKTTIEPTDYASAAAIETPHEVRDIEKLNLLIKSMKENGWQGRPILTYDVGRGDEALTGSHRIKAAKQADIEVPIYRIENAGDYVDKNGQSIFDVGFMELDDQVKWLNKFGDKNAAKLLKQEPELNK